MAPPSYIAVRVTTCLHVHGVGRPHSAGLMAGISATVMRSKSPRPLWVPGGLVGLVTKHSVARKQDLIQHPVIVRGMAAPLFAQTTSNAQALTTNSYGASGDQPCIVGKKGIFYTTYISVCSCPILTDGQFFLCDQ